MGAITELFRAFAPEYLERFAHLPRIHRTVIDAICQCRSGELGHTVYHCPDCQAILNHTVDERAPMPRESSVVRRMLAPDGSLDRPDPTDPARRAPERAEITSPTVRMPYPEPEDGLPRLRPEVALHQLSLTVFEAFAVSKMDGHTSVEALTRELELSDIEAQVLLETLKSKGVIEVCRPRAAPDTDLFAHPATADIEGEVDGDTEISAQPLPRDQPVRSDGDTDPEASPLPHIRQLSEHSGPRRQVEIVEGSPFLPIRSKVEPPGAPPAPPAPSSRATPAGPAHALERAIALEDRGEVEEAIALLEQEIQRAPQPGPLYNRLAVVLIKERRDYPRAEELLNRAIALEPGNQSYRDNLAKVLMMMAADTGLILVPDERRRW